MKIEVTPLDPPTPPPVKVTMTLTSDEWNDLRKMVASYRQTDVHRINSYTRDYTAVQEAFKPLGF